MSALQSNNLVERIEEQLAAMPAFEKTGGASRLLVESRTAVLRFQQTAEAVIAAGRPHEFPSQTQFCDCPKCTAWDALKALLEKEEV